MTFILKQKNLADCYAMSPQDYRTMPCFTLRVLRQHRMPLDTSSCEFYIAGLAQQHTVEIFIGIFYYLFIFFLFRK